MSPPPPAFLSAVDVSIGRGGDIPKWEKARCAHLLGLGSGQGLSFGGSSAWKGGGLLSPVRVSQQTGLLTEENKSVVLHFFFLSDPFFVVVSLMCVGGGRSMCTHARVCCRVVCQSILQLLEVH